MPGYYDFTAPNPRARARRGENAAEAQTPWRCEGCGKAVRLGRGDPCKCFPVIDRED